MLCPVFWKLHFGPDHRMCPRLRKNKLTPNGDVLTYNAQSQIVHELAHLYGVGIGGGKDPYGYRKGNYEPYLIQETVDLNAADSVNNAQNFAFYFAGKSE